MAVCKQKYRSGASIYVVRVRDKCGKWYPTKAFKRKIDAEQLERTLLTMRDHGTTAADHSRSDTTFVEYVEFWKKDCRGRVSDGWKISQDQMLRDHVLPLLGDLKIGTITSADVGQVIRSMETRGLGAQTRRHVYNLMNHIFDSAVTYHQWISRSPVSKRDRPTVPLKPRDVLKPDQIRRLLTYSRSQAIGPAIWIAALAGLRANEIQALRWESVHFDSSMIHIVAGFKRKAKVLEPFPKQKKHGSSPMIPILKEYLLTLSAGKRPQDFVVPGLKGSMLDYQEFYLRLKAMCRHLNLPIVTPHSLRHSCTEIWCEFGASEEDIIRLLNQSGAGSVRRYIHKTPERLLRIAQNVAFSVGQAEQSREHLRIVK